MNADIFVQEFKLYCFYVLLSLCCGVDIVYLYNSIIFQVNSNWTLYNDNMVSFDVIHYFKLFFVLLNMVSIISNLRSHFWFRNFRIKAASENPLIVYFVCLPLLILSFVVLSFIYIGNYTYIKCAHNLGALLLGSAELIDFVLIMILMIASSGVRDTGENWKLNFSNFIAISLSVILLASLFLYNIALSMVKEFKDTITVVPEFVNCVERIYHNDSVAYKFLFNAQKYSQQIHCCLILLPLAIIPYFIIPWRGNVKALHRKIRSSIRTEIITQQVVTNVSSFDIYSNLILFGTLAPAIISLTIWTETFTRLGLQLCGIFLLSLMSAMSIFLLKDAKFWGNIPKSRSSNLSDNFILWVTILGVQIVALLKIISSAEQLNQSYMVPYNVVGVLKNILMLLQVFLQSVMMYYILQRRFPMPTLPQVRKFAWLNPFLFLANLNVLFFVYKIVNQESLEMDNTSIDQRLLFHEVLILSYPLSLLYYGYCALMFVKLVF